MNCGIDSCCWITNLQNYTMSKADFEKSQVVPLSTTVSAINLVVFRDVQDTYLLDQPLKCSFMVDLSFCTSDQDRVGLFKVGWMSVKDFISAVTIESNEGTGFVTFIDIPKDEDEFYQFCYITGSSQIVGVSVPFQFVADDFEIINDLPDASLIDLQTVVKETNESESEKPNTNACLFRNEQPPKKSETSTSSSELTELLVLKEHFRETSDKLKRSEAEVENLKSSISKILEVIEEKKNEKSCLKDEKTNLEKELLESKVSLEKSEIVNVELKSQMLRLMEENKNLMESQDIDPLRVLLVSEMTEKNFLKTVTSHSISAETKSLQATEPTETEFSPSGQDKGQEMINRVLYPAETWFHNPYRNYIPYCLKNCSNIMTITREMWPIPSE